MSRSIAWSSLLPFLGYVLLVLSAVMSSSGLVAGLLLAIGFSLLFLTRMRRQKLHLDGDEQHRSGSVAAGDRALVLWATLLFAGLVVDSLSAEPGFIQQEGRVFVSLLVLSLIDVSVVVRAKTFDRFLSVLSLLALLALGLFLMGGEFRAVVQQEGPNGVFRGFGSSHHVTGLIYATIGVVILHFGRGGLTRRLAVALPAFGVALLTSSRTTLLVFGVAVGIWAVRKSASRGWTASPPIVALGSVVALVITANVLLLALQDDFALSPTDAASELDIPSLESFSQLSNLGPADNRRLGAGVQASNGREANVLIRFQAWRYALQDGMSSPLVGIGPFRFNDLGRLYVTPVPGVRLAIDATQPNTTDFGAHNLYLQVFAELGAMGLGLLLWLQIGITRRVRQRIKQPFLQGFLLAIVWASGLVSNSLLSPGLVIALLIPLIPRVEQQETAGGARPGLPRSLVVPSGSGYDPFGGATIDPRVLPIDLRDTPIAAPVDDQQETDPVSTLTETTDLFETSRLLVVEDGTSIRARTNRRPG